MSAIGGITSPAGVPHVRPRPRSAESDPSLAPESRALVPVRAAARTGATSRFRPDAAFLAHLIATREQAPQTRLRRRGEPAEAVAAYASAAAAVPGTRPTLSRAM